MKKCPRCNRKIIKGTEPKSPMVNLKDGEVTEVPDDICGMCLADLGYVYEEAYKRMIEIREDSG